MESRFLQVRTGMRPFSLFLILYYILLCYITLHSIVYYIILNIILHYIICYIILYYVILHYVILCYIISCYIRYIMLYYIMLYYVTLCYIILHYIMLYYIILYYTILYYIISHLPSISFFYFFLCYFLPKCSELVYVLYSTEWNYFHCRECNCSQVVISIWFLRIKLINWLIHRPTNLPLNQIRFFFTSTFF